MTVLAVRLEKYVCETVQAKGDVGVMIVVRTLKTRYADQIAKHISMNVNSTLLHASKSGQLNFSIWENVVR